MGYTTFTGPIRAGNILDTTGTQPGVNVSNVGQVVMAQSAVVAEDATVYTTISIPAGSQIISIDFAATISFTGTVSVGNTYNGTSVNAADYFVDGTTISMGITGLGTTTVTQVGNWIDVSHPTTVGNPYFPDSQIVLVGGTASGPGRGVITVTYLQGPNGNT